MDGAKELFYRPQVLLFGNGIVRAFDGPDWDELLKKFGDYSYKNISGIDKCPMPLRAMLYTKNNIKEAVLAHKKELYGKVSGDAQRTLLTRILNMRFDEVLTTNYSYELEIAAIGKEVITDLELKKMADHTPAVGRVESKYLLHSYNRLSFNNWSTRVWHVHGETRKPESIVMGHYNYANLLGRMVQYSSNDNKNRYEKVFKKGAEFKSQSWLDSFILGDVYVMGFGLDLSEFDLWWLLNRKLNERAPHGKVYFFEPSDENINAKIELLKLLDVQSFDCEMLKPNGNKTEKALRYRDFYSLALDKIEELKLQNLSLNWQVCK